MTISDTARSILSQGSQHPLGLTAPPATLPAAARNAVLRSLLKRGLLVQYTASVENTGHGWLQSDGAWATMQITDAGRQAVGADMLRIAVDGAELGELSEVEYEVDQATAQRALDAGIDLTAGATVEQAIAAGIISADTAAEPCSDSLEAPEPAAVGDSGKDAEAAGGPATGRGEAASRQSLRDAARALIAAWDAPDQPDLAAAIAALRTALPSHQAASRPTDPRQPRQDTKQGTVLALLRRPEGASGPQLIEATGWVPHTVRGFLAGLARKGITIEVLERVRQIGPNKTGAKGSYSIYRIAEVG
jgi:hypothetical protein